MADNKYEDELMKKYQELAQQLNAQQPCPHCGHCPTCGRGYWGRPYVAPYMPTYPWSAPPYITWTVNS